MLKSFEKDSKERQMFLELWELCQKYWISEESDAYWSEMIKDFDKFVENNKGLKGRIASRFAAAFIEASEEEMKGLRG